MNSLLNTDRPPVFCPGCAHERIAHSLDRAFQTLDIPGHKIAIVSDIGCSGLFDTFFHTHAFHGLHGRALTYAAGLKLARPDLNVIVTMGDGGLGIGGAHFLAACRRNLNLTLLILNNFNFGMTGGQFSVTTPPDAIVGSGFLNQLEKPLDPCHVAAAAGAPYVVRCSGYDKYIVNKIADAIRFDGFSVMDIWGVCTGRYTRRNKLTPAAIEKTIAQMEPYNGVVEKNIRSEYGKSYQQIQASQNRPAPYPQIRAKFEPIHNTPQEVVILGSAGQRIVTAGEILCLAGMASGLKVTQKNEYNITVLRGPSISEIILAPAMLNYTGIRKPSVVIALAEEGVQKRHHLFSALSSHSIVIKPSSITIPDCRAKIHSVDFKQMKIKSPEWALASLAVLAGLNCIINKQMLIEALKVRFSDPTLSKAVELVDKVYKEHP